MRFSLRLFLFTVVAFCIDALNPQTRRWQSVALRSSSSGRWAAVEVQFGRQTLGNEPVRTCLNSCTAIVNLASVSRRWRALRCIAPSALWSCGRRHLSCVVASCHHMASIKIEIQPSLHSQASIATTCHAFFSLYFRRHCSLYRRGQVPDSRMAACCPTVA
jgi:hypothetical protein